MTQEVTIGALLAGGYLFGSFPFGLWIARAWKGVDIRAVGSGNIGATNVWRVCGPGPGVVAFLSDVLKGFLPPFVGSRLGLASQWQILAALMAIFGHLYSVWLGFKGGKGIATGLGALLGIAPPIGLSGFGLFLLLLVTLRWVSVASIFGAGSLPFFALVFYPGDRYVLAFSAACALIALYKHRANIRRLRAGTEPRVLMPWTKRPTDTGPAQG